MTDNPGQSPMHESHREEQVRLATHPLTGEPLPFQRQTSQEFESEDGERTQVLATNLGESCAAGCVSRELIAVCSLPGCGRFMCEEHAGYCVVCGLAVCSLHRHAELDDDEQPLVFCPVCYPEYARQRLWRRVLSLPAEPLRWLLDVLFEPDDEPLEIP